MRMTKEKNPKTKKKSGERFVRTKKFIARISGSRKNHVVTEKKLPSAARVSKTLQIDHRGLSYAGQHLMLFLQHHVDAQNIKVPSKNISWESLITINKDVDIIHKKTEIKSLCGIHHFSSHDLQEIANRVSAFVAFHQPQNVNF